jgi:uncharacterized protein
MSSKPRFIFDTNAIVSAFLFENSVPGRALLVALDKGEVLLSAQIATELRAVLRHEKFDRYISPQKRERLLKALFFIHGTGPPLNHQSPITNLYRSPGRLPLKS